MKSWSSLAGLACGLLGIAAGTYFGISGAMSQPDSARVGSSLGMVGAIVGTSCSVMGIVIGVTSNRHSRRDDP